MQNLTSRISKLEKIFADGRTTYTSVLSGSHSQYFFLYNKIRQLEPCDSNTIIWKFPSVMFVFNSAKVSRLSFENLIEPTTSFSSPILRTHSHVYNFFIKSTFMVLDWRLGNMHQFYSSTFTVTMKTCYDGLFWNTSLLVFVTMWTQRMLGHKQSDPTRTRPTNKPTFQQKQEFRQLSSTTLFLTLNSLVKLRVF